MKKDIRVLDRTGRFVGRVDVASAVRAIERGDAKLEGQGKGEKLILKRDIDEMSSDPSGRKYTYEEHHGGHTIEVLKRVDANGNFHRWDNDQTFEQLRSGGSHPVTTRQRKREMIGRLA